MTVINQLVLRLAELAWSRAVIGGLIALGIYWAVFYDDAKAIRAQYAQTQQQYADAEKQLRATKDAISNADRFEREVKETVDQFNHVVDFMPEKMNTAELTTIATEVCNRAGAKLVKTEPKPGTDKADFYETTRVALSVEGTFSQIMMVLSNLSHVPRLMTIEHMDMQITPDNANQETPKLVMNGMLTGYRYVRSAAGDGKNPGDPNQPPGSAPPPQPAPAQGSGHGT